MALNLKPVKEALLAPYVLIVISSNSRLNTARISNLIKAWTGSIQANQVGDWTGIAGRNKLLFEAEKGSVPFKANDVYEGEHRWAAVLARGQDYLEVSLGLRVDQFDNLPSQIDVAKDVERIVPKLIIGARGYRFWQRVEINSEIMLSRNKSNILLSMPPSFIKTLTSTDVLKSLVPLGVAIFGGLLAAKRPMKLTQFPSQLVEFWLPALITLLLAYVIVALLHWTSSRADVRWILGKS
jgi:hypothetical protein